MLWALALLARPALADDVELILADPTRAALPRDACEARVCTSLREVIDGATQTLDLAFYGFRQQTALFEAVTRAKKRGVRVRLVIDRTIDGSNYYTDSETWVNAFSTQTDLVVDRAQAKKQRPFTGRPKCPRPEGFAGPLQCLAYDLGDTCLLTAHASREPLRFEGDIMHHKFAIADGRHVWTGSTNASNSGTGGYNANLVLRIDSPTIAGFYTQEFERMYLKGQFHRTKPNAEATLREHWIVPGKVRAQVYFSPQDQPMSRVVRPLVRRAKRRIDVAVFFLTHKTLAQDLIAAHRRGVSVRVILDATAARNGYTKHEVLRAAGIPVKVEDWGGKMHAKALAVDGSVMVGGSMNFTGAGERSNDENTVVLRSRRHVAQFEAWFDKLWNSIDDRHLKGRPDPESADSKTACRDGVDNDFDDLVDADDPGCQAPVALPPLPPIQHRLPLTAGQECSWELVRR
ncbi:MAG: phospholipase D-like domain-containing protein [Myxococcota bacterium]